MVNNNNFTGNTNNNFNGQMFAKYNQNPYQINLGNELKELNDPNSALNQTFTSNTNKNINTIANTYIQS